VSTVLVVDDRALNREFLATLLRYVGYRVIEAVDGADALELVRRERPDMVISDVLMPTMDGVAFANAVHADPALAATPIIFYTATYRLDEAQQLARSCGVEVVLSKPAEPQAILDAVKTCLGSSPPGDLPSPREAERKIEAAIGRPLPPYLHDLVGLQQRLHAAFEQGFELIGHDGTLRASSDRLVQAYSVVQSLSLRLAALLEFGLELSAERDPDRLLRLVCGAGQNVLSAHQAGICIDIDHRRPWRFVSRGLGDDEVLAMQATLEPGAGLLGRVFREGRPRRLAAPAGSNQSLGLPAAHPPVDTLLAVPLMTGHGASGWLYLANKVGGGEFNEDDEQFAVTLAAQLAPAYENLMLYDEVQQYAAQLESEIVERKFAAARLSESELRFRQLAENINEVFFLIAPAKNRLLYLSPGYKKIWGRSRTRLYANLDSWTDDLHPDDRVRAIREMTLAQPPGQFDAEFRILRPDGALRWVRARGFPILGPAGELQRIAGVAADITERHEHEERIARLSRIYAVLSGINSAIVRIRDADELMQEACRIAVEDGVFRLAWLGVIDPQTLEGQVTASHGASEELLRSLRFSADPDSPSRERPSSRAVRERRVVICNDITNDPTMAALKPELLQAGCRAVAAFPLIVEGRAKAVLVLCAHEVGFFDEQELKLLRELAGDIAFGLQYIEKEENLNYLAYYDPLTGLANDVLFHDRLGQFLNSARAAGERVAVILIDLERFTRINSTFGRQVGDALLQLVAERLGHALDEPYSLARISADMFAIAVGGLQRMADVALILHDQVLRALELPFVVDTAELQLSAKAGVALFPSDGDDANTLFRNAEAALKQAQATGERFLYYARQMNAQVAEKLALEVRLRKAIEREQFVLYYQPKLDARDGSLVGLEALARWDDPERGLMGPAHFIPLLEETGLILEMGSWALRQALSDHRHWQLAGLKPPRIAVNVSAIQLHRPDFADTVLAAIADSGADADALELEITESLIMQDIETGTRSLQRLRDAGVCIAIDDFGTGYSSLRYLAKLPLDALKIDRAFVITMLEDPSSMAIVAMVISLAHALKLKVVAEGVDAESQAAALRRMGCDEMQGYLFSTPVAAETTRRQLSGELSLIPATAAGASSC
jgi:diguanylate cyclase